MPVEWPNVGDVVEFTVSSSAGCPLFNCLGLLMSRHLDPSNQYIYQVDVQFYVYFAGVKRMMVSEVWWIKQDQARQPAG